MPKPKTPVKAKSIPTRRLTRTTASHSPPKITTRQITDVIKILGYKPVKEKPTIPINPIEYRSKKRVPARRIKKIVESLTDHYWGIPIIKIKLIVEKIITETGLTQEGQIETCFTNLIISARKQILKKNLTPKGIKKK